MFRISDIDLERHNKELYDLSCITATETIKKALEEYFKEDYEEVSDDKLYTKVNIKEILNILPKKIIKEISSLGIDVDKFISKKVAQFMILLKDKEALTPDIFIEYILSYMIKESQRIDILSDNKEETNENSKLLSLFIEYYEDMFEDELLEGDMDDLDIEEYSTNAVKELSDLSFMISNFIFWDFDFSFFDSFGFLETLKQCKNGVLSQSGGYGEQYINNIFSSVSEPIPNI